MDILGAPAVDCPRSCAIKVLLVERMSLRRQALAAVLSAKTSMSQPRSVPSIWRPSASPRSRAGSGFRVARTGPGAGDVDALTGRLRHAVLGAVPRRSRRTTRSTSGRRRWDRRGGYRAAAGRSPRVRGRHVAPEEPSRAGPDGPAPRGAYRPVG